MVQEWLTQWQSKANLLIQKECVRDVQFSGPTYQIEIFDPTAKKSYYPFLQLDQNSLLKDSFCDCGEEECLHVATSYHMIFDGYTFPWHIRFARSFYKQLGLMYADTSTLLFTKETSGQYSFKKGEKSLLLTTENTKTRQIIENILFSQSKATPESSIKFSNLSQEQVRRWREGRADAWLRFELSIIADLMKYLFWLQQIEPEAKVIFTEKKGEFPKQATINFIKASLQVDFTFSKEDLVELIPSLEMQNSSLPLHNIVDRAPLAMEFDRNKRVIYLKHQEESTMPKEGLQLGKWLYQPGIGFKAPLVDTMLMQSELHENLIALFLTTHTRIAQKLLNVQVISGKKELQYHLFFDEQWQLYVQSYLFEIGDLQKEDSIDFGDWIYLHNLGFIQIVRGKFSALSMIIPRDRVASFVTEQRVWLSEQKGFTTHLASLESTLIYKVDQEARVHFLSEVIQEKESGSFDFGEWVYYKDRGFFAKRRTKMGLHVRPNLSLHPNSVERFIKENGEELEGVRDFFSTQLPLVKSTLMIDVQSATSLNVKPLYTFLPEYNESAHHFYGEYLYVEGSGFSLLPLSLRLPEGFRETRMIQKEELSHFLTEQLPKLEAYIDFLPVSCRAVRKCDIELHYLARKGTGGLKAKLFYVTEHGRINAIELLSAVEKGQRFLFSQVGLLDLKQPMFSWIKEKSSLLEEDCFLFSTLDFMRMDAKEGLLLHAEGATAEMTEKLVYSLRNFTLEKGFDIKGLQSHLRLYQETGLKWLWFLYCNGLSGLLCDDMGLGKTHQAMALMAAISNAQLVRKPLFLVVCPTSVIYHWQDKLAMFLPHLRVQMFHGLKRSLDKPSDGGVIVTTYGIVRLQKELFTNLEIDLAIYDEVQLAKNPKSGLHKALKEIKAQMHLGLTGTPIENNLLELKALFDVTLPGYLPKEATFRSQYLYPIERENNQEKKAQLIKLIKPFTLRRKKSEVLQELPAKSEDKVYCDLSEEQQKLYKEALEERKRSLLESLQNPEEKVPYMHIFSLLSSLKQICNHPALYVKDVAHYKKYHSGKWELFEELLTEAVESEQKVVVFSQYLQMLEMMEAYLKEKGVAYAQIKGETQDRRVQMEKFQKEEKCLVFLGSLQAAGLGIDLTAASIVIMYDRWWNTARENQAIDRVHRMGQKRGVQVFKLITKSTIEERIDGMITRKGRLMEEIVQADDQATLKMFSRAELIELFADV